MDGAPKASVSGPQNFAAAHVGFLSKTAKDGTWLKAFRAEAYSRFCARGLPTRRDENWRYTSTRPVAELMFSGERSESTEADALSAKVSSVLGSQDLAWLCVNGALSQSVGALAKSDELPLGLTIMTLELALSKNLSTLRPLLAARSLDGNQSFADLSDAFVRDGIYCEVAPGTVISRPLHIVHVTQTGTAATAAFPRHIFVIGAGAQVQIKETFLGDATHTYFVGSASTFELAENAQVRHTRVQNEGRSGLHIGRMSAQLARDASLKTLSVSTGAKLHRLDLNIALTDNGAGVELDGLYLAGAGQHVDHHTVVDHQVPMTTSAQLYKGVLSGNGRAVFNGKVIVREGAQGTNARQLNRNLLLSADAEIDTKPELQIDADDVKCSHGATVGQLSADQLFYLESRGFTKTAATRLLTQAFVDEVLLRNGDGKNKDLLRPLLAEALKTL